MTEKSRPEEERERISQEEEVRREERDRRSEDLQEAWRRNHPGEEEEGKRRPKKRYPD